MNADKGSSTEWPEGSRPKWIRVKFVSQLIIACLSYVLLHCPSQVLQPPKAAARGVRHRIGRRRRLDPMKRVCLKFCIEQQERFCSKKESSRWWVGGGVSILLVEPRVPRIDISSDSQMPAYPNGIRQKPGNQRIWESVDRDGQTLG